MNVARYRTLVQSALSDLENAIMGVMYENRIPIEAGEISHHLGIPRTPKLEGYEIALHILHEFTSQGLCRKVPGSRKWELTPQGIASFEQCNAQN